MLELLADPGAIALAGSIGGGLLLKGGETLLKKRIRATVKPIEPKPSFMEIANSAPVGAPTIWDCEVFEQRLFEKKLVEEKVLLNVETFCENEKCPECYPNRPGNGRKALPTTPAPKVPVTPERIKALKKEARKSFNESKSGKQRVAEVNGRVVLRPNNVPKFAEASFMNNPSGYGGTCYIVWTWTLDGAPDGRPMVLRQPIDKVVFDSLPLAGKREPFTTKGGNKMLVCRVCSDTYFVRPGSATGPSHTFTCQRCNAVEAGRIKAGSTWIDESGISTCEPCDEPTNMYDYLHKQSKALQAQEYKMENSKKRMHELEQAINNNIMNINEARIRMEEVKK